jgi:DNA-binding CsgD family transcriptional regulator
VEPFIVGAPTGLAPRAAPGAATGTVVEVDPTAVVEASRAALRHARDEVRAGRVREGLDLLTHLRASSDVFDDGDRALLLAAMTECRLARGDLGDAMVLGDDLAPLLSTGPHPAAIAHFAKGELASALGDPELALAHYLTAGQLVPDIDLDVAPWRSGAALAQLRCGDPRAAADLARRHVEAARVDGRPHVLALALRILAVVDSGATRVETLRTARALLAPGVADRLAAQIDTDLAGLALLSPHGADGVDALALLRSAEVPAGQQELWPLQGRIRRLLDLLGETPRRINGEAAAALTASERRVARLAIDGLSNREIAIELDVSVKAVEWHLSHVFRKLGLSSRAQLATTLGPTF